MGSSLAPSGWVSSLVEWLAEIGVGLHRPGLPARAGNPSMLELLGCDRERRGVASLRGVGHLAEVHMVGDTEAPIEGMEWVLDTAPAPVACCELRVGQVWSFGNGQNVLYEIIGFVEDQVLLITWLPGKPGGKGGKICNGGVVHIDEDNFCHGA